MTRMSIAMAILAGFVLAACTHSPLHAEEAAPPKAYVVAEIDVLDLEAYREYVRAAFPIIQKYKGTFLTRGGTTVHVEGTPPKQRVMIIEFESLEAAKEFEFSIEYTAIAPLRRKASDSRIFLIEGAANIAASAP